MLQDVIVEEVREMRWGQFKSTLADAIVAHLEPIQQRYHEVIADDAYLDHVSFLLIFLACKFCNSNVTLHLTEGPFLVSQNLTWPAKTAFCGHQ